MTLITHELARQLKPTGDVEQNSRFMVIVPREGFDYYPVLVHCDYKNITRATHTLVKHIVENGASPIVVITYGNQANIGVEVASYLQANELVGCFNSIISINNERFGFLQGYATYWNNLPFQLEEKLASVTFLGKYTDVGNGFAEYLGSVLNKPTISTHLIGSEQDYLTIYEFLGILSEEFPGYNFRTALEKLPQNFTRPKDASRCVCCHKKGDNLSYFASINGKLCPTCRRRMQERKGGVCIVNWYRLGSELKIERINSRTANNLNAWQKEPVCLECGSKLTAKEHHEYHCDVCGATAWFKNQHYYRIVTTYGQAKVDGNGKKVDVVLGRSVHKISDDGKALVGSWALRNSPELIECSSCGKPCVDFVTHYEQHTNTYVQVCKDCSKLHPYCV